MSAAPEFRPTRFRKSNPDGRTSAAEATAQPQATGAESTVEYVLFGIFGTIILLAVFALYTIYSPRHKEVPNRVAEGLKQDRVNILLFGIGGDRHPQHDQLADSIMLVNLKPSTQQIAVVSIPRDLWVPIGMYGRHRINYAHEVGEKSGYPGAGAGLLCDTVSRVFNQPIHAFIRVDFSGFETFIDDIGGVDVFCQRGFYDFLFRDGFARGWHHLDGRRALAYARYRYVIGSDGENFARELRQQQLASAVRDKLQRLRPQTALQLITAVSSLSSATETNLTTGQIVSLYGRFHDVAPANIRHVSLKPLTEVFMVNRFAEAGEAVRSPIGDDRQLQEVEARIFGNRRDVITEDEIRFHGPPLQPVPISGPGN
ncbi:MAG TPA: LCP family protein [Thermoanaerobaculia bacterium]|nr:LCP family protein [Thermoanaerobaculia bacterium]